MDQYGKYVHFLNIYNTLSCFLNILHTLSTLNFGLFWSVLVVSVRVCLPKTQELELGLTKILDPVQFW